MLETILEEQEQFLEELDKRRLEVNFERFRKTAFRRKRRGKEGFKNAGNNPGRTREDFKRA